MLYSMLLDPGDFICFGIPTTCLINELKVLSENSIQQYCILFSVGFGPLYLLEVPKSLKIIWCDYFSFMTAR